MSGPHVVCLMPTNGRPEFAAHAYGLFRAQSYERKTLLIVNAAAEPLTGIDGDDVVELHRESGPGEGGMDNFLRNLRFGIAAIDKAVPDADLIAMWEDDDWYAPWRLAKQVEQIEEARANAHGFNFGHVYHLRYGQRMFFRPRNASYGATTMLRVAKARSILMTPDLLLWRSFLQSDGILESDELEIPFINVKHGFSDTASGMHDRGAWDRALDGRDRDWFREMVGPESFAFYEDQIRKHEGHEAVVTWQ